MIETGFMAFLSIALVLIKVKPAHRNWILDHHIVVDVSASLVLAWFLSGSSAGAAAGLAAGVFMSAATSLGRWWWGYRETSKVDGVKKFTYHPGKREAFHRFLGGIL